MPITNHPIRTSRSMGEGAFLSACLMTPDELWANQRRRFSHELAGPSPAKTLGKTDLNDALFK
jgi:hypothetical protein